MKKWNGIGIYDNVARADTCKTLIDIFERFDAEGKTAQGMFGQDSTYDAQVKDSMDLGIFYARQGMPPVKHAEGRMILQLVHDIWDCTLDYFHRVDHMMNQSPWVTAARTLCYPSNFIIKRYTPPHQGFHAWHADNSPANLDRILVVLLYLNDVEDGGETMFYHQDVSCAPRAGRLIVFPAGFTHVHKGNSPRSNTKYIMNGWIYSGEHWLPPKP